MSKILIIVGSARRGGNTEQLAHAFARGAEAAGNEVVTLSVADLAVKPCVGCNACSRREGNTCFQDDDMSIVYRHLASADTLVLATPVYFYGISAQLKTLVDRLHTPLRNTFPLRRMALLAVGASSRPELFDAIMMQYRLVLGYFHLEDVGTVLVHGMKERGDIAASPALDEACRLGRSL